jgi:hypothetical protein
MRRALLLLPLLAVAAGVFFWLHRGATPQQPSHAGPAADPCCDPAAPAAATRPAASGPVTAPTPASPTLAQIHFTVTSLGLPLENAKIVVQKQGTDYFMTFHTDAKGSVLLGGLPSQDYGILVEHPDHLPFGTEAHPAAGRTTPIAVDLKRGGRIHGTVTDKSGRPLPATRVLLLGAEGGGPVRHEQIFTDEQGRYAIRGVPPGVFGVRFRHKSFKPQDHKDLYFKSPTDEYRIDAVLEAGARLAGRVLDPDGKPVEGAVVVAGNKGSAQVEKTDKDGRFAAEGLNDAPVACSVTKEGYGKVTLRNQPVNGPDLEIRLVRGGTISGRVVLDEAPRQVQVTISKYDEELRGVAVVDSKFFPDPPKGEFVFSDVPPGTYWVDVRIEGYEAVERPQVMVAPGQPAPGIVVTFRKKS